MMRGSQRREEKTLTSDRKLRKTYFSTEPIAKVQKSGAVSRRKAGRYREESRAAKVGKEVRPEESKTEERLSNLNGLTSDNGSGLEDR
jgi:hypothetical protein